MCQKERMRQIVKHFDFDLTCDVMFVSEVNNIEFCMIDFLYLSNVI